MNYFSLTLAILSFEVNCGSNSKYNQEENTANLRTCDEKETFETDNLVNLGNVLDLLELKIK